MRVAGREEARDDTGSAVARDGPLSLVRVSRLQGCVACANGECFHGRRLQARNVKGGQRTSVAMTSRFGPVVFAASPLARLDPRWKIAALVLAALIAVLLQGLVPALIALTASFFLLLLSRIPLSHYCRRAAPVLLLVALFVVWLPFVAPGPAIEIGTLTFSQRGLTRAGLVLAKALTVFTLMLLLWSTTPLEMAFKAAHALRVPGLIVQIVALTYRYIFLLRDELRRLRIALRTRGFRGNASLHACRTVGHAGGSMLVRSVERAERVHHAMHCRGFDCQYRALAEFRTRKGDIFFFLAVVSAPLGLLAWDLLSAG